MRITQGLIGILASKKGVISLIMLASVVYLAVTGHMSPAIAACLGVIQSIYCWTQHRVDCAQLNNQTAIMNNTAQNNTSSIVPIDQLGPSTMNAGNVT